MDMQKAKNDVVTMPGLVWCCKFSVLYLTINLSVRI